MRDQRPSEKFIQSINPYFISKGYSFKKSGKRFVSHFECGKQIVYLPFLNLTGGTEVQLQFGLEFPVLEKIYATLKGWTKKVDTGYSFGTELNNLPEIRFSKQLYRFPLYNDISFPVDDNSINNAATRFIVAFEKHAEPFFDTYRDLSAVEKKLNKLPVTYPGITNWIDKHIVFGLLLASVYSKSNYSLILESYKDYISTKHGHPDLQRILFDANQLVHTADIKSLLGN